MKKGFSLLFILVVLVGMLVSACGPSTPPEPQGDAVAGKEKYDSTCIACHGPDLKGMSGLGKDLTVSEWVKAKTNTELVEFIKTGRPSSDPLNTTKVDMPPKGGNPALTEADILNIVAYVRSKQQ